MPLNARAPVYGFAHYVKANDVLVWLVAVSYTHLDVYKRQQQGSTTA